MRTVTLCIASAVALSFAVRASAGSITGDYLESRNAEVWIGECFANSEMNLVGDKAIMAWKVKQGAYHDVALDGLAVAAVVFSDKTFGIHKEFRTRAVMLVDERASASQRQALVAMAKALAGETIQSVVAVRPTRIRLETNTCETLGCAELDATVAKVKTRCLKACDRICSHERIAYPVLAKITNEYAAYTLESQYSGRELNGSFRSDNARSAVLGRFAL